MPSLFCLLVSFLALCSLCVCLSSFDKKRKRHTYLYDIRLWRHSGPQRYETRHFPVRGPARADNTHRLNSHTHAFIHTVTHTVWTIHIRSDSGHVHCEGPWRTGCPPPLSFPTSSVFGHVYSELLIFICEASIIIISHHSWHTSHVIDN